MKIKKVISSHKKSSLTGIMDRWILKLECGHEENVSAKKRRVAPVRIGCLECSNETQAKSKEIE